MNFQKHFTFVCLLFSILTVSSNIEDLNKDRDKEGKNNEIANLFSTLKISTHRDSSHSGSDASSESEEEEELNIMMLRIRKAKKEAEKGALHKLLTYLFKESKKGNNEARRLLRHFESNRAKRARGEVLVEIMNYKSKLMNYKS